MRLKHIAFGAAALLLLASAAIGAEWQAVTTEETSASQGTPTTAGHATPITSGIYHARLVARTNPAWIAFYFTTFTPTFNGNMSRLGIYLPTNVPEIVSVRPGQKWAVQGVGGTSDVSVTQVQQ